MKRGEKERRGSTAISDPRYTHTHNSNLLLSPPSCSRTQEDQYGREGEWWHDKKL
jgi:hypothetical protein